MIILVVIIIFIIIINMLQYHKTNITKAYSSSFVKSWDLKKLQSFITYGSDIKPLPVLEFISQQHIKLLLANN